MRRGGILCPLVNNIGPEAYTSNAFKCGNLGQVRHGTLVMFANSPGKPAIGKVAFFCSCTSITAPDDFFFAGYTRYHKVNDLEWAPCPGPLLFIRCTEIRWVLPYVKGDGSNMMPFLPHDELMVFRE